MGGHLVGGLGQGDLISCPESEGKERCGRHEVRPPVSGLGWFLVEVGLALVVGSSVGWLVEETVVLVLLVALVFVFYYISFSNSIPNIDSL